MPVQEKPKQKANCDVWVQVDVDVTIGLWYIDRKICIQGTLSINKMVRMGKIKLKIAD